jgi:hypothetical protein
MGASSQMRAKRKWKNKVLPDFYVTSTTAYTNEF